LRNYKAKINISLDLSSPSETKKFLESLYNALEPDTKILVTPQIKLHLLNKDCMSHSHLIIEISTSDISELRSAINSYLRLIKTTHLCITNLLYV
jgi:tRNA threonylcarbamoyladenosine modification (KEOPS) complex  Pcc1 subunit